MRGHGPVIADLIRNPEVRRTGKQQVQTNHLGPSFPRRRAVHRDENDKAFMPFG